MRGNGGARSDTTTNATGSCVTGIYRDTTPELQSFRRYHMFAGVLPNCNLPTDLSV